MTKKVLLSCVAIFAVMLTLTSCISHPGVIQDKSKPINQNGYTVVGDEVSATECMVTIFGVPLSDLRGSAGRRMYKNALEQAPGADALIEYTTDTKGLNLPVIPVQVVWYTLTGTPVKVNQ